MAERATAPRERGEILRRAFERLNERADDLALLMTLEMGKPLPEVSVKMSLPSRGGTTLKTDKKGRWAIAGLASGKWEFDFEAPGYAVKKVTVTLATEDTRLPPVEVKLEKAAPAGPPPEVRAALEKGDEAFKAGRFGEARTQYEKLLALRPELADTLHRQIAYTYSRVSNPDL